MRRITLINSRKTCFLIFCFVIFILLVRQAPLPGRAGHGERKVGSRYDPETSCGPVCLAVVSQYLEKPTSIEEFHYLTHAGDLGVCGFTELLHALSQKGLSAVGVRYDRKRPPRHRLPMILYVDGDHFLVAIPGAARRVCLIDMPDDPRVMTWEQVFLRWEGEAVVVGLNDTDVKAALDRDGS